MMKRCISLIIIIITVLSVCSCSGADDSEILGSFNKLAPRATELYRIVYGDALAHGEVGDDGYAKVSEDAAYTTEAALYAAMIEVFSPEYVQVIRNTAFYGVSTDEGYIGAKFIEKNGELYVNPSVTEGFGEPREFDLTNAEVTKKNPYMAIVTVPHEDGDVEVTLQCIDGVWYIDSPLF